MISSSGHPTDDLAIYIVGTGIRSTDGSWVAALVRRLAPVLVVGETAIDFGLLWVRCDPFRTIHRRRSDCRSSHTGVNADFRGRHSRRFGGERHPLSLTIVGKLCREQHPGFQKIGVVAVLDITSVANEFVEKLAPLIVPHINDHLTVGDKDQLRVLMLEAAERGALLRG